MKTFFEWFDNTPFLIGSSWLVCGQGPSFDHYRASFANDHAVLGINRVCQETKVLITHITDLHVVAECGDFLRENSRFVVMPWYPHVDNRPGKHSLDAISLKYPSLKLLRAEERLVCYNSSQARGRKGCCGPIVPVRYFSAVAVVSLLAMCGVKVIRTLGVDGGKCYSNKFDRGSLLRNGRSSFDIQFREIDRICRRYKLDFHPLETDP